MSPVKINIAIDVSYLSLFTTPSLIGRYPLLFTTYWDIIPQSPATINFILGVFCGILRVPLYNASYV
jgi:hypothetical protein